MNKTLRVSKDLELPIQFVTHRNALLGMSGSGKSNAATVISEELFRQEQPWILIDPKGDGWGIRSSRDGNGPGLDVPIFGGTHGDLPLAPRAGKLMGELVAAGKITGIFDLSSFDTDAEKARFMADFGRALFRNRTTPIHVFCDECHEYMPQPGAGGRLEGPAAECVGVWKKIAVQGRQKGIGFTLASQRSAHVNKTCLYTCETLIAMRTMGKHDRKAIEDWADSMGEAKELRAALPQLGDGEAYIFSPHRLRIAKRVLFRRRETYDSGRTPEVGETVVAPKLADLDLAALRSELATLDQVENAGDDADLLLEQNRQLRARVAELEAQSTGLQHAYDAACDLLRGEIDRTIRETYASLRRSPPPRELREGEKVLAYAAGTDRAMAESGEVVRLPRRSVSPNPAREVVHRDPKPAKSPPISADDFTPEPPVAGRQGSKLGKGELTVLTAIAQHRDGVTREQLTVLTGYKRSTRDLYLQKLRSGGFTEESGGRIHATASGRKELGPGWKPLPTGAKLREYWLQRLPGGERTVLEVLISAHPSYVTRDTISRATGYKRSTRDLYIQKLRARRLAADAERGGVKASDELF